MNSIVSTAEFSDWFDSLEDRTGKARIAARIAAAAAGNFGFCEPVGAGVSEMKIDFGPGYRLYFKRSGNVVYVLLCGGDKSTQKRDIKRALKLAVQV
ncbi:type II toxin-antitoxin system RelE/ParE family toxin [Caenimonas sp. SL110]|uniref:type II toxin-antitoxin system RelE/ParE family toxin n=1 Tax=Caenimonas sp. SL110 TaxID=1450524 RepID=UPI000653EF79|nr:type II toxin-antitoxin system RelE/ParE family toxin [Caenimonas sp. SL110]